ncbi:exosortase-associated EpsI family protein [Synoicihabitans lomoniglobus]|uniref:Exosortase-associated EpsI family protein n=1 Tax=Synoicihabitans lomoniglobus TaxID=2909285 RepID=A0AAF0CQR8_9BACT|nr:EpsI family protein [Opitutaceae bacterium LMO-M01]WED66341.1 exosortase-associated EpsI family protein [Opitutaceae bacterium LMO-M01]
MSSPALPQLFEPISHEPRMKTIHPRLGRWLILPAGVLLAAFAFQWIPVKRVEKFPPGKPLAELLPQTSPDWTVEDRPLGDTEMLADKIASLLRYDDYIFRSYRRGDVEIAVYIGYWKPGSEDPREVGRHTPDVCWTGAGWTLEGGEQEAVLTTPEIKTQTGQLRRFSIGGAEQHVVFWHLHGGVTSGYGMGDLGNWKKRAPVLLANLRANNWGFAETEQCLIRISSNRPLDEVEHQALFGDILRATKVLGLAGVAGG